MKRWQVWFYRSANGYGPIPERPAFGGATFTTKQRAEDAWYDSCPERNDKAVMVKVGTIHNGVRIPEAPMPDGYLHLTEEDYWMIIMGFTIVNRGA